LVLREDETETLKKRSPPIHCRRVHLDQVVPGQKLVPGAVARKHEVVITGDAVVAHEDAAAAGERALAVDPDIKGLHRLPPPQPYEHALEYVALSGRAVEKRPHVDLGASLAATPIRSEIDNRRLRHSNPAAVE